MRLIEWKAGETVVAPEALLIEPLKAVWDEVGGEERGLKSLGYVWMMASPNSPYAYLSDRKERKKAVVSALDMPIGWRESYNIKKAINYYESTFTSTSGALLKDMRVVVDKVRKALREVDLGETDANGKLDIKSVETVAKIIATIPRLIKDLNAAERAVMSEEPVKGKMRGSGEKSLLDDGFDIID